MQKLKVSDLFKGRISMVFCFRLFDYFPQPLIQLFLRLTVHQDVQHRLARDQLQIRGLLWGFSPVAEVETISKAISGPVEMIKTQLAHVRVCTKSKQVILAPLAPVWNKSHLKWGQIAASRFSPDV